MRPRLRKWGAMTTLARHAGNGSVLGKGEEFLRAAGLRERKGSVGSEEWGHWGLDCEEP